MRSAHIDLTSTASQQNWIKDKENLVSKLLRQPPSPAVVLDLSLDALADAHALLTSMAPGTVLTSGVEAYAPHTIVNALVNFCEPRAALHLDEDLEEIAQQHANAMAAYNSFSHEGFHARYEKSGCATYFELPFKGHSFQEALDNAEYLRKEASNCMGRGARIAIAKDGYYWSVVGTNDVAKTVES